MKNPIKKRLDFINSKISDNLDFDFKVVSNQIDTMESFNELIMKDFYNGKQLFYRGERKNDFRRHLLPTMLRNSNESLYNNDCGLTHIDAKFLLDYYSGLGDFVNVFSNTMGKVDINHLYEISAFSQHYCDFSPLIDFSKCVYPALSFAIKDRSIVENDIVLYVLELKDEGNYTDDINVANQWIKDYSVYVYNLNENNIGLKPMIFSQDEIKTHFDGLYAKPVPKAKLIDVPINTRMKFQQGVFLLLTDFQLINTSYLTKNIRELFSITKYIINKDICPEILNLIQKNAPWYSFKYLTDVESAFKIAVDENISRL